MEEKLDKLISLMELQNKAWEHSLQLLNGIYGLMVDKYKSNDILLEQHPPMTAAHATPQPATNRPLNTFGDQQPYGYDIEEERKAEAQSFPANLNATSEVGREEVHTPSQEPQQSFREAPPEVPVTSKAEMMEQVENKETSS